MPSARESESCAVLVAGMHRSGTSATAGLLAGLGVDLGPQLVQADENNPKGYFEHADIWRINHRILCDIGVDWDDPGALPHGWSSLPVVDEQRDRIREVLQRDFSSSRFWGIKDPRLSRLLPLWLPLMSEIGVSARLLMVLRHPAEVSASLAARDGLSASHATRTWLRYVADMERTSRGTTRAFLLYDDLLADAREQMARVAGELDVEWPSWSDSESVMEEFVERGLRHHRGREAWYEDVPEADRALAEKVYETLRHGDPSQAMEVLDETRQKLDEDERQATAYLDAARWAKSELRKERDQRLALEKKNQQIWSDLQWNEADRLKAQSEMWAMRQEFQETQGLLEQIREELDGVYASRSWALTRPLRLVAGRLRYVRKLQAMHDEPSGEDQDGTCADETAPNQPREHDPAELAPSVEMVDTVGSKTRPFAEVGAPETDSELGSARIVMVTPEFIGPTRNGGIGTAFTALAKALAAAGHDVTVLYTWAGESDSRLIESWRSHYANHGISLMALPPFKGPAVDAPWDRASAYKIYDWLKGQDGNFDIAYFPDWCGEAYFSTLAKRLGLAFASMRFVIVTHGSTAWAEAGNYKLPSSLDELERHYIERKAIEWADALVSPSAYLIDWMRQRHWVLPDHTEVIQNLMPEGICDVPLNSFPNSIHEWVFFGRLEPRKGLRLFCDAVDRAPASLLAGLNQITFLGKGLSKGSFESLSYIAERTKKWSCRVEIITEYDRDEALVYLENPRRLAVIPSLVENSPYTVLECLLRGIAFVAADVGGIAELVAESDREWVLFAPRPAALVERLLAVQYDGAKLGNVAKPQDQTFREWLELQPQLLSAVGTNERSYSGHLREADQPLVSVCLVHYNRPRYLVQALESLRNQTFGNFEVILVDDGSTTQEATQLLNLLQPEFERRGWTLLSQQNAYLGAARNLAARNANGEYLLFMDDDNIAKPHELATFVKVALHSSADILTTVSDYFFDDEPPRDGRSRRIWLPLGAEAGVGIFRNNFGDANALVRRNIFDEVGGFTEDYGIGHEDWEFFARATLRGAELLVVPEPLFWYRVNAKSMLQTGEAETDHARSARPYLEELPVGLGASVAYALALQRQREYETVSEAGRSAALLRLDTIVSAAKAGKQAFNPALRTKFFAVRDQEGWRMAIGKAIHYVRHR